MPISPETPTPPCIFLTEEGHANCWAFDLNLENIPSLAKVQTTILQGTPIGPIEIPINWKCSAAKNPKKQLKCSNHGNPGDMIVCL